MPPRIDELTRENLRTRFGRMYVNGELIGDLQGIWATPEITPPPERHIDERLWGGYATYQDIQEWLEPRTIGVDVGTDHDNGQDTFLSAFKDALRKSKQEDEEYKKALDKQWNELMFGQAQ